VTDKNDQDRRDDQEEFDDAITELREHVLDLEPEFRRFAEFVSA